MSSTYNNNICSNYNNNGQGDRRRTRYLDPCQHNQRQLVGRYTNENRERISNDYPNYNSGQLYNNIYHIWQERVGSRYLYHCHSMSNQNVRRNINKTSACNLQLARSHNYIPWSNNQNNNNQQRDGRISRYLDH